MICGGAIMEGVLRYHLEEHRRPGDTEARATSHGGGLEVIQDTPDNQSGALDSSGSRNVTYVCH